MANTDKITKNVTFFIEKKSLVIYAHLYIRRLFEMQLT